MPLKHYTNENSRWPRPGIYPNATREMYDSEAYESYKARDMGAFNRGFFATFNRCPEKAEHRLEEGREERDGPTKSMLRGLALHSLLLEPDTFEDEYALAPGECSAMKYESNSSRETEPCTNPAKKRIGDDWYCGVHAPDETDDVRVLPRDVAGKVKGMKEALLDAPSSARYLDRMIWGEPTILWTHQGSGLPMRCRIDGVCSALPDEEGINLIELKTVQNASKKSIERHLTTKTDGWLQDPIYREAFKTAIRGDEDYMPVRMIYLCVEETAPHVVQCHQYDHDTRDTMRRHVDGQMGRLAWCLDNDQWPKGYEGDPVSTLRIPNWARRELNLPR